MRRVIVLAAALAGCASAPADTKPFQEACPVCKLEPNVNEPTAEAFKPDSLLGSRWGELSAVADTHVTFTNGEPHIHSGVGFEWAFAPTRDNRLRLFLGLDATGGAWGDREHGRLLLEHSAGVRWSFVSDPTVFDVYTFVSDGIIAGVVDLPAGQPVATGNILGGGFGLRIFRSFAVEVTSHWDYSLDRPFVALHDGSTTMHLFDLGLGFHFDFCSLGSACNRKPRKQASENATCALYADATAICSEAASAGPAARKELCEHAVQSMAISDARPMLARDAVSRFLGDLQSHEAGSPRAAAEQRLTQANECMTQWRTCGRRQECLLGQQNETIATRRIYSPYVLEVLQALGCTPDGTPTPACGYACEDPKPAPKPAMCAARP